MHSPDSFLPYGRQTISEDDISAVLEVLRSPFLTQGPAVPSFEQAVANRVEAQYAVAVNSATSNVAAHTCPGIVLPFGRQAVTLPWHWVTITPT